MFEDYGINRVVGVKDVLPVMAWKLDSSKIVYDNELLLKVTDIHLEAANFKQVCNEALYEPEKVKDILISMVNSRGKLHNPYTNTGGLIFGKIEKIGCKYKNKKNLKAGDEILVLISASMIPLHIDRIKSIDFVCGQISVDGYGILYNGSSESVIKRHPKIPLSLLMMAFEESSSISHVHQLSKDRKEFLIIGNNLINAMLYGYSIRKAAGESGHISLLLYKSAEHLSDTDIRRTEELTGTVFNEILYMNLGNPLKCAEEIISKHPKLFDLSVNSSDTFGTEAINVFAAREKGIIFFTGLINNYNYAVYLTEGIGKELSILCSDGYAQDYDAFTFDLLLETIDVLMEINRILHRTQGVSGKIYKLNQNADEPSLTEMLMFPDFVYRSRVMQDLVKEINKASKYDCPVLITGETGVGKDKVTKLIHSIGNRKMYPCIKVNCAAIPLTLLESEFFGYETGAFTGANIKGRKGYFEQADKGVLFLDEISSLPLELQAKLLRVLQDKEFYRVGGEKPVRVDVRIIAASNKNLKKLIDMGEFREDLYYRLAVLVLHIPPLRSRKLDIIPLVDHFVEAFNKEYSMEKKISDEGLQYFLDYNWPGNIRELENLIQRLLINCDSHVVPGISVIKELSKEKSNDNPLTAFPDNTSEIVKYEEYINAFEKHIIQQSLELYKTTRRAAEALGMTQAKFMRRKRKHSL